MTMKCYKLYNIVCGQCHAQNKLMRTEIRNCFFFFVSVRLRHMIDLFGADSSMSREKK